MGMSGLDIYKLLPKTNCRECGFATCLAFAMQLAKKGVSLSKCPYISETAKEILESLSEPPIKLVRIGVKDSELAVGNETVLFRHEEKFHHPCGIGCILEDGLNREEIISRLNELEAMRFERVGQLLKLDLVAIRQTGSEENFVRAVFELSTASSMPLVLMARSVSAFKNALEKIAEKKPLLFPDIDFRLDDLAGLVKTFHCPVVISGEDLTSLSQRVKEANALGISEIVLNTTAKHLSERLWDLTQIRRLALKKSLRSLGYPVIATVENKNLLDSTMEAATLISKYANIILLDRIETEQALALLTLRQNIYSDPQKPLQIEPKLYAVGQTNQFSPLLVTTNFSLTYYTVLGEVEASKIPSYILSVDTEGMSVLTAWAAEKFTPERINQAIQKANLTQLLQHREVVIPGYVAVMSGDLQEQSGWQVLVGPKEAAGIPAFLKSIVR